MGCQHCKCNLFHCITIPAPQGLFSLMFLVFVFVLLSGNTFQNFWKDKFWKELEDRFFLNLPFSLLPRRMGSMGKMETNKQKKSKQKQNWRSLRNLKQFILERPEGAAGWKQCWKNEWGEKKGKQHRQKRKPALAADGAMTEEEWGTLEVTPGAPLCRWVRCVQTL